MINATAAQKRALDAAAREVLFRHDAFTRKLYSPYCTDGTPVTSAVVERCYANGWLKWNPKRRNNLDTAWDITEAGREALSGVTK